MCHCVVGIIIYAFLFLLIVTINDSNNSLATSLQPTCKTKFHTLQNTILDTEVSQRHGAKHIIYKQRITFDECYDLCCSYANCTMALYQNKSLHLCYLFDCGQPSVCSFSPHSDYTVILNEKKLPPHPFYKEGSADDNPDAIPEHNRPDLDLSETFVASKLKDYCEDVSHPCQTKDNSLQCQNEACLCAPGFLEKHSKCVPSVCPQPEVTFQCDDTSQEPVCLPFHQRCNGVPECADKSDEFGCIYTLQKPDPLDGAVQLMKRSAAFRRSLVPQGLRPYRRIPQRPVWKSGRFQNSLDIEAANPDVEPAFTGWSRPEDSSDSQWPEEQGPMSDEEAAPWSSGDKVQTPAAEPPAGVGSIKEVAMPHFLTGSSEDVAMLQLSQHQTKVAIVALVLSLVVTAALALYGMWLWRRGTRTRILRSSGKSGRVNVDEEYLMNGMHL